MFVICFILSCAALLIFALLGGIQYRNYDRNKVISPRTIVMTGTAIAAFVWFLPVYYTANSQTQGVHPFISTVLDTITIFAASGIDGAMTEEFALAHPYYTMLGEILSLWAPFLTFTFVLSFFRSAEANLRYFLFPRKTHVFSELNAKSLAMAKVIRESKGGSKCIIVFSDILDKNEEAHLDLVDGAKKINAILFRNDVEAIEWTLVPRRLGRNLNFYLISDDSGEKIRHARNIITRYNDPKTSLYVFDNGEESKILLRSYEENLNNYPIHIKIARIDEARLLTYSYLSNKGISLFREHTESGKLKDVNLTVVGFGQYGTEMFKALFWYCQMPGYRVNITIMDKDPSVRSRFEAMFPGIEVENNDKSPSITRHHVEFKNSAFGEKQFIDDVRALADNNNFFVFLGNDETNLLAVNAIRCARAQAGKTRCTEGETAGDSFSTVIDNQDIRSVVSRDNGINVINDIYKFFPFEGYETSSFIEDGLAEHLLSSGESVDIIMRRRYSSAFEAHRNLYHLSDYNFYSSLSKALHRKLYGKIADRYDEPYKTVLNATKSISATKIYKEDMRRRLQSKGGRVDAERELRLNSEIEHVRWSAYMLTEGFVYSETKDSRFKMHSDLVPVEALMLTDYMKDI